jgi:hypothetical protein
LKRLQGLTSWSEVTADGETVFRPTIAIDYTFAKWRDATGQPSGNLMPDPNLMLVVMEVDDAVADTIDADVNYTVMSSEAI